jgi:diguanylate cyclase (GGDEF)-like protein
VYQKIKHIIFTLIYLILWAAFYLMAWDPIYGNVPVEQGMSIYQGDAWRPAIGLVYQVSGYLMWPIYLVYGWIQGFIPQNPWFPGFYTATIPQSLNALISANPGMANAAQLQQALNSPLMQQAFVGYVSWLYIVGVLVYSLLNPLVDHLYSFVKNLAWNVLIEFSFTKRKEAKYQEALEKRAADLMKLNVEYKNLSKEASVLATSVITDELTKVYNKRFFLEKMAFEIKRAKDSKGMLTVAMSDIDHFKKLNDTYGHLMGDKVLKAVAQVAKKGTPGDCFCCRFGGEEFAIIMPGKDQDAAMNVISVIHRNLPLLRFEEDPSLRVTSSFGMMTVDFKSPQSESINVLEDIIKLADDELYKAKLNGRNRIEANQYV